MSRRAAPPVAGSRASRAGLLQAALACALLPGLLHAQSAVAAMDRAADRYAQTRSVCADFAQILEVRLLDRTVESAGRMCQQRPNLFSMRFTDPDGDLVVSDGEYFWTFYPSLNPDQVVRLPLSRSTAGHDFYQEFLDDPDAKYAIEDGGVDAVGRKECRLVNLTPVGNAAYRRARVWLDPETDLLCRVEVHHENGSIRTVTLTNVTLNPILSDEEFSFVPPEGVRVVDPPS